MIDSVQIIGSRSSGGAEGFYCRLTSALAAREPRTVALLPPGSALMDQLAPDVARVEIAMRGVWDLWARHRIRRWVKHNRPAIVQTWMGRATRLTHLPRRSDSVHVARLGGFYDTAGYAHADAWVGNTRGICDYLISNGLPSARVFYIGNFVAAPNVSDPRQNTITRAKLGIPDDAWVLLTTGRLHPNKGIPDLLRAIAVLPATVNGRELKCLIVGDGPLRDELHGLTRELGISDRVKWTGWQNDTARYYSLADLFVCPSRHEPLGNVVLEAWSYRLPIVSTRSQGPSELMVDGEDGRLVECEQPHAMAVAIREVLELPHDERAALAAHGHIKVQGCFSQDAIVAQYQDLYEELAR